VLEVFRDNGDAASSYRPREHATNSSSLELTSVRNP
jgi:hypothetical protein